MKTIKAKVHMLPTEDTTDIIIRTKGNMQNQPFLKRYYGHAMKDMGDYYTHLYFTTDEEIKEGDWIFEMDLNTINQAGKDYNFGFGIKHDRKIIATTDPKLKVITGMAGSGTGEPLPQIPQSFIEEYCKAGGIDEVLVEYEVTSKTRPHPFQEGSAIIDEFLNLKLNPDSTIIIHPVEEKMYTLKQIKHMFDIGRDSAFQEMHFDEAIKYRDNELNKMD